MKKLLMILLSVMLVGALAVGCAPEEEPEEPEEEEEVEEEPEEEPVGEKFGFQIVGIDAGAGIMGATETALETYPNLADYTLMESSDAAMTAELDGAYGDEEWIVVTGWTPHWKFGSYDLKFLDDPEGVYGDAERIDVVTRLGFSEDNPEVAQFLENFYVTDVELGELMGMIEDSGESMESAIEWLEQNEDVVEQWIP